MPASDEEAGIRIELVFATTEKQTLLSVVVPEGCTAANAVTGSTLTKEFPNVDFSNCPIGVWGRPVSADYRLVAGDRLEIYRPLRHDPREARRELATQGRSMGQARQKPDSR